MTDPAPSDTDESTEEEAGRRAASGFRRLAMIVFGALVTLGLVTAGTVFALYRSATAEVPEYEAVLEVDEAEAEAARREFESQLSALASDTQSLPEWKSRVTAWQINAWLATRLRRDFPGFRQAGLLSPRVMLKEGEIVIAARSVLSRIHGVISLTVRPMITESDELALEIASAKIGNLTLPIDPLMAQLRETPLGDLGPIRFSQTGDTAAVIVDLDRIETSRSRSLRLTGVDVRDGELLLRGESITPEGTINAE